MAETKEEFRTVRVEAHPYADIAGSIKIPKQISDGEEIRKYVGEHFSEIRFSEPDLDFRGTDYEIYIERD